MFNQTASTPSVANSPLEDTPKPPTEPASHADSPPAAHFAPAGQISADITPSDRESIFNAIRMIREKLDTLQRAGDTAEQSLVKVGKKGHALIRKARDIVVSDPGALPRSFDIDEFKRDATLLESLRGISEELRKLTQQAESIETAAGSDTFIAALSILDAARFARKGWDMNDMLSE